MKPLKQSRNNLFASLDRPALMLNGSAARSRPIITGMPPEEPPPAIPPRQPLLPDPRDLIGVSAQSSKIASYP
jgi:hypothetical protein